MNKIKVTLTFLAVVILVALEAMRELGAFNRIWQYLSKETRGTKRQVKQDLKYKISKHLVDDWFARHRKGCIRILIAAIIALW